MNKHRFRLIFSKKLGFLIPVAEINNSQRKPGQTNGPSIASAEIPSVDWTLKPLPGVIRCMQQALVRVVLRGAIAPIFAITCVPGMAAADMIVDPNAAPEQRATLNQAPNGVPVIEIANPNANGLSHNRFQEFDVQKPGVVFNNSTKDGSSQIAGLIQKNPNLNQQAKAILTEVTGNKPSSLSGTLEVFGGKADLLIANPNGISVNGVSTINANRLLTTTGRVASTAQGLQFAVDDKSGRVVIGADGIDTNGLSYFDIVARSIALNGAVGSAARATDISALTGLNTYDLATGTYSKNSETGAKVSEVAIDGGLAGAMHGRSISLVSTESGAGIRHESVIHAAQDISINADGDIALAGVIAGGNVAVTGSANIKVGRGKAGDGIDAGKQVNLIAGKGISISNDVKSNSFGAQAESLLITAANLSATGTNLPVGVKAISIKVGDFVLSGDLVAYDTKTGQLLPADQPLVVKDGKLQVQRPNGKFDENFRLKTTAMILSGGGIDVDAKTFANREGIINDTSTRGIRITADSLVNQGVAQTKGDVELLAQVLDNLCAAGGQIGSDVQKLCGGIFAGGAGNVSAKQLTNEGGLVAKNAMTVQLGAGKHSNASTASITGGLGLLIQQVLGQTASLDNAGELHSGGELLIILDALSNRSGGSILASRNTNLQITNTLNNAASISASRQLNITAGNFLNATGAELMSGADTNIAAQKGIVNEANTAITVGGNLVMTAGADMNTAAVINVEGGKAVVHATGELVNANGSIVSAANLDMKSGGALTNESGSLIYASKQIKLESAGDMNNRSGSIVSSGVELTVKAGGTLTNSGESIVDGLKVSIEANNIVNQINSNIAGYDALSIISHGDLLNESGATLTSDNLIDVQSAGTVTNDHALINASELNLNGANIVNRNTGEILGNTLGITASDTFSSQSGATVKGTEVYIDSGKFDASDSNVLATDYLQLNTVGFNNTATVHSQDTVTVNMKDGSSLVIGAGQQGPTADRLLTVNTKDLDVNDSLSNPGAILVNATGNVRNNGEILTGKSLAINASGSIDNMANKLIWAAESLSLRAGTTITNWQNAMIRASENLFLKANVAVINQAGRIEAGKNIIFDAPRLENRSEVSGDLTFKDYLHIDNWYTESWAAWDTEYFHTEFWLPRIKGDNLTVNQGVIKAGADLLINQFEARNTQATVSNLGGLIAAAGNITLDGNLENLGSVKSMTLTDYMKSAYAYAHWTVSESAYPNGPELRTNMYDLFDKNLLADGGNPVIRGSDKWMYSLRLTKEPDALALMSAVFGADWKNLNYKDMRQRWIEFKVAPDKTLDFYADKQAEISAGSAFSQTGGALKNGTGANWGENRQVDVKIGSETLKTVDGDLDAKFNRNSAFDPSAKNGLSALRDAINSAKTQQELMDNNPLFSANPPPLDLRLVPVAGDPKTVAAAVFTSIYPLYETRSKFIDQSKFYGSQYFLKTVGYNTSKTITVLGDAYFDNELILRTVENTVGNFFAVNRQLSGINLVQSLMNNAATQVAKLGLVVGQPLTQEQYDQLDSDIVWYEPQVVNGIIALVPKVYISKNTLAARLQDQRSGSLISARNVLVDATAVENVNGIIRGSNDTLVYSKTDVNNVSQGGAESGIYGGEQGRLAVAAEGKILNQGGNMLGFQQTVVAGDGVTSSATTGYDQNGSLVVRENGLLGSHVTEEGSERFAKGQADKTEQEKAALLAAKALAEEADKEKDPTLAGNELPAAPKDTSEAPPPKQPLIVFKPDVLAVFNSVKAQSDAGSLAENAESSLNIISGGDINLTSTRAEADNVTLQATGKLNIEDLHAVGSDFKHEYSRGFIEKKEVNDTSAWAASKGSEINANQLKILVSGDLNMTGGALNSQSSEVKVGGDMNIAAGKDLAYREVVKKTTEFVLGTSAGVAGYEANASWGSESGIKAYAGQGSASQTLATNGSEGERALNNANAGRGATTGLTARIGVESVTTTDTSQAKTYNNAQLNLGSGSVDVRGTFDFGGADINKDYQVSAKDREAIAAGKAPSFSASLPTLAIDAGDIKTTKFEDTFSHTVDTETTFGGFMYEAHSSVLDVATNIANRVKKAADGMQATSGEAGDDVLNSTLIAAEAVGNASQLAFGEVLGASSTVGVKTSKDHYDTKSTKQNINKIGGNISMTTNRGDIELNGVDIAGGEVTLDSAGKLVQTAAKSTSVENTSSNTYTAGATASFGVTAKGDGGVGASVVVSGSHDRSKTNAESYTNGQVAGTDVTIRTKGDHTMIGSNIVGNSVDIDVGGTQTISSVQDTSKMEHERGSWSASGGVAWDLKELAAGKLAPKPTGSVSASGGKDYDDSSITARQSGIKAGNLNLHVAGDQKLTGSHIINKTGEGEYHVDGQIIAENLTDTRDKDGGYAGVSAGISRNGVGGVTVQGGRVDQVRYNATQKATIDLNGGDVDATGGIVGNLNTDGNKLVKLNKDVVVQGTDIKLEMNPSALKSQKKKTDASAPDEDGTRIVVDSKKVTVPDELVIDNTDAPTVRHMISKKKTDTSAPEEDSTQIVVESKKVPVPDELVIDVTDAPTGGSEARHMTSADTSTPLKNLLSVLNGPKGGAKMLKDNPIEITVGQGADGKPSKIKITSAADLEALNGQQVKWGEKAAGINMGSDPKNGQSSTLYLQIKKFPNGGYGYSYVSNKKNLKSIDGGKFSQ